MAAMHIAGTPGNTAGLSCWITSITWPMGRGLGMMTSWLVMDMASPIATVMP